MKPRLECDLGGVDEARTSLNSVGRREESSDQRRGRQVYWNPFDGNCIITLVRREEMGGEKRGEMREKIDV